MLPLNTERLPTSSDDLSDAIRRSLLRWLDRAVVNLSGTYPAIDRLAIDASGSTADPRAGVPDIEPVGKLEPGPRIAAFQFTANPIRLHDVKASIEATATDAVVGYGRNRRGERLLVLQQVKDGRFTASIDRR